MWDLGTDKEGEASPTLHYFTQSIDVAPNTQYPTPQPFLSWLVILTIPLFCLLHHPRTAIQGSSHVTPNPPPIRTLAVYIYGDLLPRPFHSPMKNKKTSNYLIIQTHIFHLTKSHTGFSFSCEYSQSNAKKLHSKVEKNGEKNKTPKQQKQTNTIASTLFFFHIDPDTHSHIDLYNWI